MGSAAGDRQVPVGGSRAPAVVVHRDEEDLLDQVGDERGFLEGFVTFDDQPLVLEGYQVQFLLNLAKYRWITKARQIGFSFIIALEALARCHLRKNYTAHIVSFSQAEAKEKILIARQAYESLPVGVRKKLVVDSKLELGFASPGGGDLSRIVVHPSKAPRGRKGDIYLDELAHYADDAKVYKASRPLITRTAGQLTGCSTPLGCRGTFWEIATEELRRYPNHDRQVVPWYLSTHFCQDVAAAATAATRGASTIELVEMFATEALLDQYDGLLIEDFEQEFCAKFQDDSVAFLPYDLILSCAKEELCVDDDVNSLPPPRGRFVAGYDLARKHDRSVLTVFDEHDGVFTNVLKKTLANLPFHAQEAELRRLLTTGLISRLSIDSTGMGAHLAENLEIDYPGIVRGEHFTNDAKERWATNVKILLQQQRLLIPRDRRLIADFHAIKKVVTQAGNYRFDAERTADGHADGFWSVALAVQREAPTAEHRGGTVRVRILGGADDEPEPGSYEWNKRLFPDGVYTDDNPPPPLPTFRPVTAAQAAAGPILVGRGERRD